MSEVFPHPRKARDLTGREVSRWLTVVGYLGKDARSNEWWRCRCYRCMELVGVRGDHLRSGAQVTCGQVGCRASGPKTSFTRSKGPGQSDGKVTKQPILAD